MREVRPHKFGLVLGLVVSGMHLLWAIAIALGFAQPLLDWIYWLHMLSNPFQVAPFNVVTAGMLVIVTFVVGYAMGWVIATVWNKLHGK